MATAAVTLTREHRDAIRDEVEGVVGLADDIHLRFPRAAKCESDREWFRTMAWQLTVCARLLDQLGWEEHGDRDSYVLAVDVDIARFMGELERSARGVVEHDAKTTLLAPREEYAGYEMTDEEWREHLADAYRLIDIELDAMDAARRAQAAFEGTVA